jgi:hypothetical protein
MSNELHLSKRIAAATMIMANKIISKDLLLKSGRKYKCMMLLKLLLKKAWKKA